MELCKTRCKACGHLNRWYSFKWPSTPERREHNRVNSETCVKCGSTDVEDVEDDEVMAPYRAAAGILADMIRGADRKGEPDAD